MNKVYLMKNQGDLLLILLYVKVNLNESFQWFCLKKLWRVLGLILWKIPSPSPESLSLFKKRVLNWKCLGLFVTRQLLNLKTDSKSLYYSLLKLKYIFTKKKMRGLKCASLNNSHVNSHRNHTNRIFYKDIFITIDRSLRPTGRSHWIIWRLWGLLCVEAARKGNEITGCNWKWWCKSIKPPKRVYWPHPSVPLPWNFSLALDLCAF